MSDGDQKVYYAEGLTLPDINRFVNTFGTQQYTKAYGVNSNVDLGALEADFSKNPAAKTQYEQGAHRYPTILNAGQIQKPNPFNSTLPSETVGTYVARVSDSGKYSLLVVTRDPTVGRIAADAKLVELKTTMPSDTGRLAQF